MYIITGVDTRRGKKKLVITAIYLFDFGFVCVCVISRLS